MLCSVSEVIMTYAAHEKEFYEKHYQKNLSISEGFDGNLIWRQCFSPEARYGLVDKTLTSYLGPKRLIVELGCAQGHTLTYCKDKFNFSRAVGVDIAFPRNQINNLGIEFLTANLNQGFPFSDGEVDVMMAMMCFEHLFCPFFIFWSLSFIKNTFNKQNKFNSKMRKENNETIKVDAKIIE